jgi:hypothetical protein
MEYHLKAYLHAARLTAILSSPLLFVDAAVLVKALVVFNIYAFVLAAVMILGLKNRLVDLARVSRRADNIFGFIARSVDESEKRGN